MAVTAAMMEIPGRAESMDSGNNEEQEILQRCRRGDLPAYRLIFERYEQPFLRTAWRLLGRRQEAEDAVQETFLKFHRRIGQYREGSKFSTYFFRILINTCTDILRKRRREPAGPLEEPVTGASSSHELRHSIERAIDGLPERMRSCFLLFAVEELSQEEIAGILEISVGAVKANIHHARVKLRESLAASRREVAS